MWNMNLYLSGASRAVEEFRRTKTLYTTEAVNEFEVGVRRANELIQVLLEFCEACENSDDCPRGDACPIAHLVPAEPCPHGLGAA